jgi:putative mycofactocin binding protein MftB
MSATVAFHPDRPYRLASAVVLRAEPFGALAYHFGQRRLTYLAADDLVDVVAALAGQPTAAGAMAAVGVPESRRPVLERALAGLVERGVLDAA